MYPRVSLFIDGDWTEGASRRRIPVVNPATAEEIGSVAHADQDDMARAVEAAMSGFAVWRKTSAFERCKLLRKSAELLRARNEDIARIVTLEQGKPLAEARAEAASGADLIDWFAEEGRRAYGRIVPARGDGILQMVVKEPVGPVAAFTPWNFPINQAIRKIAGALSTGCSIIIKGPEDTPASVAELVRIFADAGLPPGVLNLLFGTPAAISEYLVAHPNIRKVSFTGSTSVGKHIASMAGAHMKRVTMELGGHAPSIVFDDADVPQALKLLSGAKFRNAGQICIAPTRFLVHERVYENFVTDFVAQAEGISVGDGASEGTTMGPLCHSRRVDAMESLIADAKKQGARIRTGGERSGNKGYFFSPTVLTDVPLGSKVMNDEPFGPIALISPFSRIEEAVAEANRLPYGLAAYAFTKSARNASALGSGIESGMVAINHMALGLPEVPLGGVKDSGYGSEGGLEGIEGFLTTKFVTHFNG
jgi:succinate-semialdehyde dehydrogenase/glutarate-semialdehyde dehydrogenase